MVKPKLVKKEMFSQNCEECNKVIYGYTVEHVIFLLAQHKMKHKDD